MSREKCICDWDKRKFCGCFRTGVCDQPATICAASIDGIDCQAQRADGSLFCARHKHASNRLHLPRPITHEGLAFMMQRDGEPQ